MPKVINDFKRDGKWVNGVTICGERFVTRSGMKWGGMKQRCKKDGHAQKQRPSYIGCTYSLFFSKFQNFADWFTSQVGYECTDYHIDKDILVPGNKEYHEDRCLLIPKELNCFLTGHEAARGKFPQGVCAYRDGVRFMAYTSSGAKRKHIGLYNTVEEAQEAYIRHKTKEARLWADKIQREAIVVDSRVIDFLSRWEFKYE